MTTGRVYQRGIVKYVVCAIECIEGEKVRALVMMVAGDAQAGFQATGAPTSRIVSTQDAAIGSMDMPGWGGRA